MRKLSVFNHVSLDGYFVDGTGDMSWAKPDHPDPKWDAFVTGNVGGGGVLVFGRVTYEMMAGFWPTPLAREAMPVVADAMNRMPKLVFSRTLERASWSNTRLVNGDAATELRRRKQERGESFVILGSGRW